MQTLSQKQCQRRDILLDIEGQRTMFSDGPPSRGIPLKLLLLTVESFPQLKTFDCKTDVELSSLHTR